MAPGRSLHPRRPVLVGLGTANESGPVAELMTEAVRRAALDVGAPRLLGSIDRIVCPQGSWRLTDPARTVAARIEHPGPHGLCRSRRLPAGTHQPRLAGRVGRVRGRRRRRCQGPAPGSETAGSRSTTPGPPDEVLTRPPEFIPVEIAAGLVWPVVQQYAVIGRAGGGRRSVGRHPARRNRRPVAALQRGGDARPGRGVRHAADGREIAPRAAQPPPRLPYNLRHSTQWTLDQASALLICSAGRAADAGVPSTDGCSPTWRCIVPGGDARPAGSYTPGPRWASSAGRPRHTLGLPLRRAAAGRGVLVLPRRAGAHPSASSSASISRARPPSPVAWPSPAGRSTATSCSRSSRSGGGSVRSRVNGAW